MKKIIDSIKKLGKTRLIGIAGIFVLTIFIIVFISINQVSLGYNSSLDIPDITVSNLRFNNAQLDENKLTVNVQNITSDIYELKTITVTFKDSSSNIITKINGYIGEEIEPNEIRKLDVKTDIDLSNTAVVEYTVKK